MRRHPETPGVHRRRAGALTRQLGQLLFPAICAVCRQARAGSLRGVCASCAERLREIPQPRCPLCGGALDGPLKCCSACMRAPTPEWENAVAVFPFHGPVRRVVHRFKYGGAVCLAPFLARRMYENWLAHGIFLPDLITPVPLHWTREWRRGYNQAELLARPFARLLGVRCADLLRRRRRTGRQVALDAAGRKLNLAGAFAAGRTTNLAGLAIVLVDDVMTTGATLGAAARTLRDMGCSRVAVVTVARG